MAILLVGTTLTLACMFVYNVRNAEADRRAIVHRKALGSRRIIRNADPRKTGDKVSSNIQDTSLWDGVLERSRLPSEVSNENASASIEKTSDTDTLALKTGTWGVVKERRADGSIGATISNAGLTILSEDGNLRKQTVSGDRGRYKIQLPVGRYKFVVRHENYVTHSPGRGFVVVRGKRYTTYNVFLQSSGGVSSEKSLASRPTEPILNGRPAKSDRRKVVRETVSDDGSGTAKSLPSIVKPVDGSAGQQTGAGDEMKRALANSRWTVGKVHFKFRPDGSLGGRFRFEHSYWEAIGDNEIALIDKRDKVTYLRIRFHDGFQRGDAAWKDGKRRTATRRK